MGVRTILAAVASVVLLAGCGTSHVDNVKLEAQIHAWAVKNERADPSVKVDCPSDVPVKAGSTFHCLVSAGKQTARLTVTIENSHGDVTWATG